MIFTFLYWIFAIFTKSDNTILDQPLQTIYFSVVTFTTLGYGDISPTGINKLIAIIEATVGIIFIGLMINRVFHVALETSTKRKLDPIRKGIALRLLKVCRNIFNDTYHMILHENKTDLNSHGFPPGTTQEQADYWTKSVFKEQLDAERSEIEKIVTMNASYLGDELAPCTYDLVTSTEKISSAALFLVDVFIPGNNEIRSTLDPTEYIEKAQLAYEIILSMYPDIEKEVVECAPNAPDGVKLIEAFQQSNELVFGFDLLKKQTG